MNYLTIHIEGGLLSPDFLETLPQAAGQKPADFGLQKRDSLVDEVTGIWADVTTYWKAFQTRLARAQKGRSESITTITREQWIIPLLEALGYDVIFQRKAAEIDGRSYAISHRAGDDETAPPVHIVAIDQKLGDRPPSGRGRLSPHALVQDYLNRTDDHLWGLVTNGAVLRLLRDSTYFTRPAYIEFDLEQMLEGERLDEFFLLYRLAQRSRLPAAGQPGEECLLEQYYQETIDQGSRIRDGLRAAVAGAILTFANGFLRHPANEDLRRKIAEGRLTDNGFYQQLLYLIYRLLFLMVAEERSLLEVEAGSAAYYRDYFSVSRLRALAGEPLNAPQRFDDLYLGWRTLCRAFHDQALAAQLGVPALNGELFRDLPDLDHAALNNRDFLHAIRDLSHFTAQDEGLRRRVNYAALDVEELGSVYESLLDEQPLVTRTAAGEAQFSFVSGTERKTTGSYYTPRELVNEVLKSALLPVIAARLQEAGDDPQRQEEALLALNVCDPACGSGHFLLAAARRIGYELARVRSGADEPAPEGTRAATREVITHCIYGVDKNPLAVDLCKVALWIEGHSRGKPLTFLDYRIRCGDSLVGVLDMGVLDEGIPDDAFKALSGDDKKLAAALRKQNKEERAGQMTLFDQLAPTTALPDAGLWQELEDLPEDTPEQIEAKRAAYEQLHNQAGRARAAADMWTAAFFSTITPKNLPQIPTTDTLRRWRQGQIVSAQVVAAAGAEAAKLRFFHWPLEFPHVFAHGGFDAILGNPPWEKIKLEEKQFFASRDLDIAGARNKAARGRLIKKLPTTNPQLWSDYRQALHDADALSLFLRSSDRYPLTARGDINTYAVFSGLSRSLIAPLGRAGIVVPTGIATDSTTSLFFGDLVAKKNLAGLKGFENEAFIFPSVHHAFKFCVLSLTGSAVAVDEIDFIFFCRYFSHLADEERHFRLTPDDFARINPNTLTTPIFRTKTDAELTKQIYRRVPVLENEQTGENPWGISFLRMLDMSNDSHLFANEPGPGLVPLYEAKMMHQFDHRFSTYENATQANLNAGILPQTTAAQKADPNFAVRPRYWVPQTEVEARLRDWPYDWLLGFRDITSAVVERTSIFSLLPLVGVGNSAPLMMPGIEIKANDAGCLLACLCSLVFDFVTRHKVGGTHMNFFIAKQLPVLPPEQYGATDHVYIVPRILELVYTSWDMAAFVIDVWEEANDGLRQAIGKWKSAAGVGSNGKPYETPFFWDDERRAQIRAELDAYYARLYGLTRNELRYILDPADVYGPDFPGETFRVLKEKEIREYGEYRTQRLVLAAWDAQQAAIDAGELPWDHPAPGSPITAAQAPPPATRHSPPETRHSPPAAHKPPPAAPQQLSMPQVHLPDLRIAAEGSFNQRLKRVQNLSKDPSPAQIAELTVYLAAPESSIRWYAGASLSKIGGPNALAAVQALLEKEDLDKEARQEAENTLKMIS